MGLNEWKQGKALEVFVQLRLVAGIQPEGTRGFQRSFGIAMVEEASIHGEGDIVFFACSQEANPGKRLDTAGIHEHFYITRLILTDGKLSDLGRIFQAGVDLVRAFVSHGHTKQQEKSTFRELAFRC